MGLSIVSEINGDLSRKSQIFPLQGFALELDIGVWGQKLE